VGGGLLLKVAFIKSSQLFLIRHPSGRSLRWTLAADVGRLGWSVRLLDEVASRYPEVVIFNDVAREVENNAVWPKILIRDVVKQHGYPNVTVVDYDSLKPKEAMEIWKKRILAYGGHWSKPINHLNSNYMMLDLQLCGDHIIWIGEEGSQEEGIFPDKLSSFMDLAKLRESKTIW